MQPWFKPSLWRCTAMHVMVNWHLSKQGIRHPVSRGHIAGSSLQLTSHLLVVNKIKSWLKYKTVRLNIYIRLHMTSKFDINVSAHSPNSSGLTVFFFFLPKFKVIFILLTHRRKVTWNLLVKLITFHNQGKRTIYLQLFKVVWGQFSMTIHCTPCYVS